MRRRRNSIRSALSAARMLVTHLVASLVRLPAAGRGLQDFDSPRVSRPPLPPKWDPAVSDLIVEKVQTYPNLQPLPYGRVGPFGVPGVLIWAGLFLLELAEEGVRVQICWCLVWFCWSVSWGR